MWFINRMDSRPAVLLKRVAHPPTGSVWRLVGTRSQPLGDRHGRGGSHVSGRVLHRQAKGRGQLASANDPRLLIGVGAAERVEQVEIRWAQRPEDDADRPRAGPDPQGCRAGRQAGATSRRGRSGLPCHELNPGLSTGERNHPPGPDLADGLPGGRRGWAGAHGCHCGSRPSLGPVIALAEAGKLDEAEAKVRARLAADPDDGAAHLLLAQIFLKRLDPPSTSVDPATHPHPRRWALDHLMRVQPRNPTMAITFQLCRGNALNRLEPLR